jgi:hypothetical protein
VVGVPTRYAVGTSIMQTFAISLVGASSHFLKCRCCPCSSASGGINSRSPGRSSPYKKD